VLDHPSTEHVAITAEMLGSMLAAFDMTI